MRPFSVKQYSVIPVKDSKELTEALQKTPVDNLPDFVSADVAACEEKACFFIVTEKANGAYSAFASFVFDKNEKKVVHVKITASISDQKELEKVISKITDWMYNKIGGIYFRIDATSAEANVAAAAQKAGYKKKKNSENVLELDKNVEIGIISLISGL